MSNFKIPPITQEHIEEGRRNWEKELAQEDKTDMIYWYPKLLNKGIRMPDTVFTDAKTIELYSILDGKRCPEFERLVDKIWSEGINMNTKGPFFLRTGQTSAKHYWKNSCYLPDLKTETIKKHLLEIIEFSAMADLRMETWVLREILPVEPAFTAFYGEMPITKERRYFVRDGKVEFHHPYWPPDSIEQPSIENWREKLDEINLETQSEVDLLTGLSEHVGSILSGYWSVDWLYTKNGWYLTDMAEGQKSFMWKEYKYAKAN